MLSKQKYSGIEYWDVCVNKPFLFSPVVPRFPSSATRGRSFCEVQPSSKIPGTAGHRGKDFSKSAFTLFITSPLTITIPIFEKIAAEHGSRWFNWSSYSDWDGEPDKKQPSILLCCCAQESNLQSVGIKLLPAVVYIPTLGSRSWCRWRLGLLRSWCFLVSPSA